MKSQIRFVMILALCFNAKLVASTEVSGIISGEVRWRVEGSPYIVTGDLLVPPQSRLEIDPGVKVLIHAAAFYDPSIAQIDHLDSVQIAIKIFGSLRCKGDRKNAITFSPFHAQANEASWYGLVLTRVSVKNTEINFCEIAGASKGISISGCGPKISNTLLEFNNVGIECNDQADVEISNCTIVHNFTAGIMTSRSNPVFYNNIIAFNQQTGVWCDGLSSMTFKYNCLFGNGDGNFLQCNPLYGLFDRKNKNKDSTDAADNIYKNPIFAGSVYDSLAVEKDVSLPTERSRIKDTLIARVLHDSIPDSLGLQVRRALFSRYQLSKYSPCRNSGNPEKSFNDDDGSRNDMGTFGGPESPAR